MVAFGRVEGLTMQLEERAQHPVSPARDRNFGLAAAIGRLLGGDVPVGVESYDGSRIGPEDSSSTLVVRSPLALRYALTAPGELGFARAYVSGELDVEGDIFEVLALRDNLPDVRLGAAEWLDPGAHRRNRGLEADPTAARRSACTAAATPRNATPPPSRTTTTSPTTSTASCSALR